MKRPPMIPSSGDEQTSAHAPSKVAEEQQEEEEEEDEEQQVEGRPGKGTRAGGAMRAEQPPHSISFPASKFGTKRGSPKTPRSDLLDSYIADG